MRKHVLFFIHGMGSHDESWHLEGLKVLKSVFGDYEILQQLDFDELFEPIPVVYNNKIETWRERMSQDFQGFRAALIGAMDPTDPTKPESVGNEIDKVGGWIGAGEPDFVWSHAMDVILYRFAATLSMAIDVTVAEQILGRLKDGNVRSWSIIAHSLGTSVAHNAINSLYGTSFPGIPALDPAEYRAKTIMMVANVSRVIQRPGAKVFETRVKPGLASGGCVCRRYLNVRHRLDPFTIPKPFNPDLWPDATTYASNAYQHIQPSHIHFEKEEIMKVHLLSHYLKNPRVHVPLFRSILGQAMVPDAEFTEKKTQFDGQVLSSNIDAVRARLEAKLPALTGNWRTLVSLFKRLNS